MTLQTPRIFREEAVAQSLGARVRAEVLQVDASTTRWGIAIVLIGIGALLVFACLGRVTEYATGPAIVHLEGCTRLTAVDNSVVTKVDVVPGLRVHEGDVLVRFYAANEKGELDAAAREFDDQLAKLLARPDDRTARESLASLRSRLDLGKAHVDQRVLRAPYSGVVGDVRVHEGQLVEAGASVLELQRSASQANVIALLPGRYRPLLHAGGSLRFEADGFNGHVREIVIDRVGDEVVGPSEAARFLGSEFADTLAIKGPVVLVQARLASTEFEVDGQMYAVASGMYGKAEVAVRSEPLAYAFVPALKPWLERVRPKQWLRWLHPRWLSFRWRRAP